MVHKEFDREQVQVAASVPLPSQELEASPLELIAADELRADSEGAGSPTDREVVLAEADAGAGQGAAERDIALAAYAEELRADRQVAARESLDVRLPLRVQGDWVVGEPLPRTPPHISLSVTRRLCRSSRALAAYRAALRSRSLWQSVSSSSS